MTSASARVRGRSAAEGPLLRETELPGVGVRLDMIVSTGARVGVVHHRSGRRELFISSPHDPDTVAVSVGLSADEARSLAEALGSSPVVETLDRLRQHVEGIAIDWLDVPAESPLAGRTIGDGRIRTRTGVSVVALLRDGLTIPAPGPEQAIASGDTLVVVGTSDGIEGVERILVGG